MAKFIIWKSGETRELINVDAIANAYNEKGSTRIVLNIGMSNGDTYNIFMPYPIEKLFEAIQNTAVIAEIV